MLKGSTILRIDGQTIGIPPAHMQTEINALSVWHAKKSLCIGIFRAIL